MSTVAAHRDPKQLVAAGYDLLADGYAAWASEVHDAAVYRYIDTAVAALAERGRALDLGCNTGTRATRHLAARFDVVGVDISPVAVSIARREVPEAQFLVGDMANLGFAPASFDLVCACYSLIHVPRREHASVLAEIAQWLRPGGHLVVTMGAGAGGEDFEDDWLGVPMFWSNWDAATNERLVREAGFEIVDVSEAAVVEHGSEVRFLWVVARRP